MNNDQRIEAIVSSQIAIGQIGAAMALVDDIEKLTLYSENSDPYPLNVWNHLRAARKDLSEYLEQVKALSADDLTAKE